MGARAVLPGSLAQENHRTVGMVAVQIELRQLQLGGGIAIARARLEGSNLGQVVAARARFYAGRTVAPQLGNRRVLGHAAAFFIEQRQRLLRGHKALPRRAEVPVRRASLALGQADASFQRFAILILRIGVTRLGLGDDVAKID